MERAAGNIPSKPFNQFKHEALQGTKHVQDTLYEQRRKLGSCFNKEISTCLVINVIIKDCI
jgi:hypothetical protein